MSEETSKATKRSLCVNNKIPKGFELSATKAFIKYKNRYDLALIYSKKACVAAGVWTQNTMQAACVSYNKNNIENPIHAVVINSGCANACTGEQGSKNCNTFANKIGEQLGIDSKSVLLSSTGVIGEQLPLDRMIDSIPALIKAKDSNQSAAKRASKAIMTTDTYPKSYGVKIESKNLKGRIFGIAKGAGMIHPNMATLLGFAMTDIAISRELLQKALSEIVKDSFNQISVDGDTSTNDMVVVLSNGCAGNAEIVEENEDYLLFKKALKRVCVDLAKKIAADGEGATHNIEVVLNGATSKDQARKLSRSIITSNLVKTAIFGKDANWGRIICAMGYSEAEFDSSKLHLSFESKKGKITIVENGVGVKFNESKSRNVLSAKKIRIVVNLNSGEHKAKAWGCDLSYGYIRVNTDYRS